MRRTGSAPEAGDSQPPKPAPEYILWFPFNCSTPKGTALIVFARFDVLSILRTNRKDDLEPSRQDETDRPCTVEFLPAMVQRLGF